MAVDRNAQSPLSRSDAADEHMLGRNDALARLSRGMAHDFNNILHVVKNATELLRQKFPHPDADTARLLDMLNRNAERGKRLTRELLAFSGRQPLEPVALNVNRLIADMQHRLRDSLGRGPLIETALAGSLWLVNADPAELEVVVCKLAENARDAMPGGGKLTIETDNVVIGDNPPMAEPAPGGEPVPPGEYVRIAVRDQGVGMNTETLARAFEPYFTTKEPGPMTGLGLSRVYGSIRQMHGHVTVQTRPGAGTTVALYLPRLQAHASQDPLERHGEPKVVPLGAKPGRPGAARGLAGLRVLVVEDESLIGMLAEDLLEQLGCRMVGLVSSVPRALEAVRTEDFDLALLDVDIGGEPVYPVALALQVRGVPFLFMSGYGGLDAQWRGRPIVQKPFDLDQLKREIERSLNAGSLPA